MKSIARILTCALSLLIISAVRQEAADARLMRSRVAYTRPSVSFAQRFAKSGRLHMKPASLAFGRVKVGATSKSLPLTLSNLGGAPLKIGSISTVSNQFKIANQCASELAGGGDSCQVTVAFAPTSDKRNKAIHVHAILDITETSGRTHKVLLSGVAYGPDDPPTPTPSSQATPDPLVHAVLVTNSACNTVTSYPIGAAGNAAPTFAQTGLCNPTGIAVDSNKNVYITNKGDGQGYSSITEYAAGSNGDAAPINTIVGPHTGLDLPIGLAVIGSKIYVANDGSDNGGSDSITVYTTGSNGDVTPIATISGSNTRLNSPAGVAADSNGNIYVVNPGNNTVTIYSAGSNGNVAPNRMIMGFDTGLYSPASIALDANANIYVGNSSGEVMEYPAGSNGDAMPVGNISTNALGIAVDGSGKVYISGGSAVDVYTPMGNGQFSHSATFGAFNPVGVALDTSDNICVVEPNQDFVDFTKVDAFQVLAAGSGIPIATVTSPNTKLVQPTAIALDAAGNIYIANPTGFVGDFDLQSGAISVYPPGSGATVSPSATIVTDFESPPSGIALDATGRVYVTSNSLTNQSFEASDEVTIYSPLGQNLSLIATIEGDKTQLSSPTGIALDAEGNIYVANLPDGISIGGDSITVYSAESSGNVGPIAVISGANTGIAFPSGVALDSSGNIYVSNEANDSITVYAAGSNGNVAPMATISGSNTGLDTPSAIALDSTGIIYVTNEGGFEGNNASVTVYPAGSNGNASPGLTIAGSATLLARPQGIAVLP